MDAATRDGEIERVHRYFEKPLLAAAVLSIPTTILQFTNVSESLHTLGEALNWLIWLAFLAELVAMIWLTPNRARYLLTNPIDRCRTVCARRSAFRRACVRSRSCRLALFRS